MSVVFILPPVERYSSRGLALSTVVHHTAVALEDVGIESIVVSPRDPEGLYTEPTVIAVRARRPTRALSRAARALRRSDEWDWSDQDLWHRTVSSAVSRLGGKVRGIVVVNDLQIHRQLKRVAPDAVRATWLHNEPRTAANDLRQVLSSIDHVFCCSEFILTRCRDEWSGVAPVLSVVHNCVDTLQFSPPVGGGSPRKTTRVLFAGRVEPNKGPDLLVECLEVLASRGLTFDLTVAGPTTSYSLSGADYQRWLDTLMAGIDRLGGRYVGNVPRPELPELYHSHDVVAVLSRSEEPFGLVALEAMAAGCLVIASDRGGLREATGGHAVYVDPDRPSEVVDALLAAANPSAEMLAQRAVGATWASSRDWAHAAREIAAALGLDITVS